MKKIIFILVFASFVIFSQDATSQTYLPYGSYSPYQQDSSKQIYPLYPPYKSYSAYSSLLSYKEEEELNKKLLAFERAHRDNVLKKRMLEYEAIKFAPDAKNSTRKFVWPTLSKRLSQDYISSGTNLHRALDIDGEKGDNIWAIADGEVIRVSYNLDHGNYIKINHGNGLTSLYAHLDKILVLVKDKVFQGQVIGYMGNTGKVHPGPYSDGSHLHLEVEKNGQKINFKELVEK
ncbi:MAG: M23 family metallopeptidase [Candidatus Kuenenbacteria bacterium]